jgi:exosome complex component RRP42
MIPEYVIKLLENGERLDGRKLDVFRDIKIETNVVKRAEGSARVKFGKTDVIVGIKTEIGKPFPDMPNMGILKTEAEFTPIASPDFESGPPGEDATELARIVDRGIRESEMIDLEKLCIKEGEKAWEVFVDIQMINHDGNLIDASALAAVAALRITKVPKLEDDKIIRDKFEMKLPLLHTPITVTVGKFSDKFIVDPSMEEEEVLDSKISVAVMENGNICAMQKSGEGSLSMEDINEMIDLAVKKSKELRKLL